MTPEQLAALPHDSLGPELNAVIWSLTAVSAIFLALRLYCRAVRARVLWWDDWFLLAAWVAIFGACIVVSVTVTMGFGKHSWDIPIQDLPGIFMVYSVAGTFSICASVWSKTSFALTILKVADVGWMRKLIWAIIITMNVFMGVTALLNYIRCWPLDKLWDFTGAVEGTCWPMQVIIDYDIFSAVYSGAMDILLAMLPWKLIWNLQMRRNEKIGVAVAMSLGIFAGVTSFVKASYMPRLQSIDVYDAVSLNYWSNAESTVTIIAASIPLLRVLLKDVTKTIFTKQQYYGASGNTDKISSRLERENNHVTVTARSMHRTRPASQGTESSELDILRKEGSPSKSGGILQTSNFVVEYEPRDWKGERSDGDGDGPQSA
ncbi:hypothetical protein V8F06_012115 [Rhypophila decipiens]